MKKILVNIFREKILLYVFSEKILLIFSMKKLFFILSYFKQQTKTLILRSGYAYLRVDLEQTLTLFCSETEYKVI